MGQVIIPDRPHCSVIQESTLEASKATQPDELLKAVDDAWHAILLITSEETTLEASKATEPDEPLNAIDDAVACDLPCNVIEESTLEASKATRPDEPLNAVDDAMTCNLPSTVIGLIAESTLEASKDTEPHKSLNAIDDAVACDPPCNESEETTLDASKATEPDEPLNAVDHAAACDPTCDESTESTLEASKSTEPAEPLNAVDDAVACDDKSKEVPAATSTTSTNTSVIDQAGSGPCSPAFPLSDSKALATQMTYHEHHQILVLKEALGTLCDVDEYLAGNDEEKEKKKLKILNDTDTTWRCVFNAFIEPVSEEEKKLSSYTLWSAARRVKYPEGKRLGKGVGQSKRGLMWAEMVTDFWKVKGWTQRDGDPYMIGGETGIFVTSSMLFRRFKDIKLTNDGKYTQVRQIMRAAETEDYSRILDVYSIAKLIEQGEAWIAEEFEASWVRPTRPGAIVEGKQRERWEVPEPWPPTSVFDPSAYPTPWPLEPFKNYDWLPQESIKNFVHKPKLQEYIPEYLLPEELIVHDPWGILNAEPCQGDRSTPWNEKEDNICIYEISRHSFYGRYKADVKKSTEAETTVQKKIQAFLENAHSSTERPAGMVYYPEFECSQESVLGPTKPPVYVVYPPKPKKVAPKQAHMYLSPSDRMGEGHHSFVYRAELEVPRSLLVDDLICKTCVYEDVKSILEEEDGPRGEKRDPQWDELSGQYVLTQEPWRAPRMAVLDSAEYQLYEHAAETNVKYEGPYRAIQTKVGWQNLERAPYCEHLRAKPENIHPLTVKVEVAAKLSKEDDEHLADEVQNYRNFPTDFFQHRNGYILHTKVHNSPSRCGAIVPQFYGFYSHVQSDERNTRKGEGTYMSPILLLEDCGTSITPSTLTADERNECISLFLRMHDAGWLQLSLYSRNIVCQIGPLTDHPVIRRQNFLSTSPLQKRLSFRVIDFGRSKLANSFSEDFEEYRSWEMGKLRKWFHDNSLSS